MSSIYGFPFLPPPYPAHILQCQLVSLTAAPSAGFSLGGQLCFPSLPPTLDVVFHLGHLLKHLLKHFSASPVKSLQPLFSRLCCTLRRFLMPHSQHSSQPSRVAKISIPVPSSPPSTGHTLSIFPNALTLLSHHPSYHLCIGSRSFCVVR
jgi:hypothetical protein